MVSLQQSTSVLLPTKCVVKRFVYPDMLYDYALLQIENEHLIFQQDWAPPTCANIVCELMNEKFLWCRLGQDWREAWQPRSPDSLNCYLWDYLTHN